MRTINASNMDFLELGEMLRGTEGDTVIDGCLGQRFIAAGMKARNLKIHGVPGNALGAYLDGAEIEVFGNAQDAVGDTMNAGSIIIHGSIGDTAGYAMRGGEIYVQGNAGYRAADPFWESIRQAASLLYWDFRQKARSSATIHARACMAESCICDQHARMFYSPTR